MIEQILLFPVDIYVRKHKTSKPVPENDHFNNRPSRYDIDAAICIAPFVKTVAFAF